MHSRIIRLYFFIVLIFLSGCTQDEPKIYDYVIVGGGLMGSSVAWQLSKAGKEVLLLEQQPQSYSYGSSYGSTRIARSNNRGNDIWSYLHNTTVGEVEELIAFLQENSVDHEYAMSDIYKTADVSYVGRSTIYDKLLASLIRQDVQFEMASTPQEGREKFGYNLPKNIIVQKEYNLHSGTINPQTVIAYCHTATQLKGNQVLYQHEVLAIEDVEAGYVLKVKNLSDGIVEDIRGAHVVSAVGPYTGKLLSEIAPYFDELISPQRVFLAFLQVRADAYNILTQDQKNRFLGAYPVINSSTGTRDGSFFAMFEGIDENQIPIIKIGGHFQRSVIENLDKVWEKAITEQEEEWSLDGTIRYMQQIDVPLKREDFLLQDGYSCVYSLTNNEVPYVTEIPNNMMEKKATFLVMGGMSGVGAKGSLAYGLIAANTMLGIEEKNPKYTEVTKAMGYQRLMGDIEKLLNNKE